LVSVSMTRITVLPVLSSILKLTDEVMGSINWFKMATALCTSCAGVGGRAVAVSVAAGAWLTAAGGAEGLALSVGLIVGTAAAPPEAMEVIDMEVLPRRQTKDKDHARAEAYGAVC